MARRQRPLFEVRQTGDGRDVFKAAADRGHDFDGDTYDRARDHARLEGQLRRVFELMRDGRWRTLAQIAAATTSPEGSVSARLRDLRKPKFGAFRVDRRRRSGRAGQCEYRLGIPPPGPAPE